MKPVPAVAIPFYKKNLTPYEVISLQQILKVLSNYPIIFFGPTGLKPPYLQKLNYSSILFFDAGFENINEYSKLLLSQNFYQYFERYTHILLAQLDTFVFRDELDYWASLDFDYIGSPWMFEVSLQAHLRDDLPFLHRHAFCKTLRNFFNDAYMVGNGGLSLRKTKTFLDVLNKHKHDVERYLSRCRNNFKKGIAEAYNEDVFWGVYAPKLYPSFRIPKFKTALKFAFEINPQLCYKLNGNELPFGCHAWDKHGTDFWRRIFVEKYGYEI